MSTVVEFESISTEGIAPALTYHTGQVIQTCLYIHGGVGGQNGSTARAHGQIPSSALHIFDLGRAGGMALATPEPSKAAPHLSHHASMVWDDNQFVVVGGWNGKQRTSDIHHYDPRANMWTSRQAVGFPVGAGLSSHSLTVIEGERRAVVVGREGGLRTQRRHGTVFTLRESGGTWHWYPEESVAVASRSGHTAHHTMSGVLLLGGRSDSLVEVLPHYPGTTKLWDKRIISDEMLNDRDHRGNAKDSIPRCRAHHTSLSDKRGILMHGGETFDGKKSSAMGEVWYFSLTSHVKSKTATKGMAWLKLHSTSEVVSRMGHISCLTEDFLPICHGGTEPGGKVCSNIFKLKIHES